MSKQAVLLIHGIGEQRPMDTLRGFVDTVWTTDKGVHRNHPRAADFWSKPYSLSEDFELRLLTTAENKAGLRTDFYELYWAHLMQGTKFGHVAAWAKTLLMRWPWTVPRQLRLAYWVLIGLLVVALYFAASGVIADFNEATESPAWTRYAISLLILPLGAWLLTSIVGDAARYLHVAPSNVQRRHEIRSAGVAALKALHDPKYDYQRIIIVGHSLGTVIGYDVLTHTWPLYNRDAGAATSHAALDSLETLAKSIDGGTSHSPAAIQKSQRDYFNELRSNGATWRVSDFITLGSPLAHASLLLTGDERKLRRRIVDREFPTCLPALETQTRAHVDIRGFSYPAGAPQRTPHHAAVFGPTRWTNMYFPCSALIRGDLIGGPLATQFGAGVRDVPVRTRLRLGFLSHTLYWTSERGENQHVAALREALDLCDTRG